jgi:phage terminase large subunit GpA-like protein
MGAPDFQAADAFRLVDSLWARYFAPPADLTVEQWAEDRLVLPREMSAEPGPIRLDRTPYLRQIFADLADPKIEEIDLMFATQLGKSTALLALLGYVVDHEPAPMMLVLPTLDVAKKFSKQRIAPLIAANDCLRTKIREARSRDSDNTTLVKGFAGGMLVITGANSPAGLASMPAKIVLMDEVDDYPDDAGGQGEPTRIVTARQDTFARRKRVKSSSPKRPKGRSMIEADFERGTRCRYYVPCPHCEHRQTLRWQQIQWRKDPEPQPDSAAYVCEACGALIEEHHKTAMLAAGEWRADNPGAANRSYHLNSLYSPLGWLSWRTVVEEFLHAKARADAGSPEALRTWINTRLAETWEKQAEKLAVNELQAMAIDQPLRIVPAGALLLVAFVDVQDDRFEVAVWGLGEGGDDMYTVDHLVIPANPGLEADWAKVDAALAARYPHALGGDCGIEAAAVDTGGHFTHDVYRFVRRMPSARKVAATKGMDRPGLPVLGKASVVDVNWRGGVIKHGVKLWFVGVNAAKDLLFARIKAGRVHMSRALPEAWFEQLAAEHRVLHRTARGERTVWVKKTPNARNEALDCAVGALWCAERLGVSRWPKKYWEVLRQRVVADLFSATNTPPRQDAAPADSTAPSALDTPPAQPEARDATGAVQAPDPVPGRRVRRPGRMGGGFVSRW